MDGTRNVLEVCAHAGVERVVYTSSAGTLGVPKDGGLGTETIPVSLADMVGPYKRSKFLAERIAEEFADRGLGVVIVNPTNPIGPWEVKPTPTGQVIVDYLLGRMFGTLDTGLNLIQSPTWRAGTCWRRDWAAQARSTSWAVKNHSLSEIFRMLERITGIRAPRVRIPHALIFLVALANESLARATGRPPRVPLAGVRMARKRMYFSAEKAVRDLGLPQRPAEEALKDAVDWFVAYGYAPRPPAYPRHAA